MNFNPRAVYEASNGELTKALYRELDSRSIYGQLATALFRASKRSSAAKKYRGRSYRHEAYAVKSWSVSEVCRILTNLGNEFVWGWSYDEKAVGFEHTLYLDLKQGQVSFHSPDRLKGPDYPGEWDGTHLSADRIIAFCEEVLTVQPEGVGA